LLFFVTEEIFMHLAEGVLSTPILVTGASFTITGVAIGLRHLDYERIPQVAVLSAAFFTAALIHVPIGVSSVHLILHGLMGLILGWAVFPAILIALLLQAILFGFGGLSVLGVNVFNMAFPALLGFYLFNQPIRTQSLRRAWLYGFATGMVAIAFSAMMIGLCLWSNGEAFLPIVQLILLAHLPIMLIEGFITATIVVFLRQVRPELLMVPLETARA
jgi:cobalt/nickel transport system permease protein